MNRTSVAFLSSYGLSFAGNSIAAVVLPLVVLQTTGSATGAGVVAAATALPAVLAGLFMGGIVDRYDRRTVSVITDVISGLAIAALPLIDAVHGLSLGWFVALGIVSSFGDVPGITAREALLPHVARHSGANVGRLIALRESVSSVVMLVGPALAAGLVVLLDGSAALWVTAATSLAAAAITLLLPRSVGAVHRRRTGASVGEAIAELREGWVVLFRSSPVLLAMTLINLVLAIVLTGIQGLLLPVHFLELGQEGRLGLVLSSLAAGMLLGSGLYAGFGSRVRRRIWFVAGMIGSVAGIALIGSLPSLPFVFAGAAILGLSGGMLGTVTGVLMVELVPDAVRGRVTGTQNAMITAAPSLGIVGTAVLIDHASLATGAWVVVGVWAATVVVGLLARPLRRLDVAQPVDVLE